MAVAVAVYLAWATVVVLRARSDVAAGLDAMTAARERLDLADLDAEAPVRDLEEGRFRFAAAAGATGSPALAPVRVLPVVGRQLASVDRLATSAAEVADVALDLRAAAVPTLAASDDGGADRVRMLRELADAAGAAESRLSRLDYGPEDGLFGQLAEGRAELVTTVAEVRDGLRRGAFGARGAADLLAGPHRYLVLAANNAEMRAGAGMFLSAGVLETRDGAVALVEPMQTVADIGVPNGAVAYEGDLAARWGWLTAADHRNLMASPHFPAAAELAAQMWEAAGRGPVDGVLAFDPVVLEAVLTATGPVEVNGRQVTAGTILAELYVEQYVRFADEGSTDARRDELGDVVGAVLGRFDAGGWDPGAMVRELTAAARGRHLLAWSADPVQAEAFALAGIDGRVAPDSMLLSVLNFGGNKLDAFLEVGAEVVAEERIDGTAVAVTVQLRNTAPEGLPPYIAGPHPLTGVGPGDYLGFLSLTVPGASSGGRFDGEPELVAAGPDHGTKVLATRVEVPRGGEATLTARFVLPPGTDGLTVAPSARVPAVGWRSGGESWSDEAAHRVRW